MNIEIQRCVTKVVKDILCKHSPPALDQDPPQQIPAAIPGLRLTSQWKSQRATSLSKAVIATKAAMTRAKRGGNDRDFCAAIRVKRKLFKLRAFTVDLQAPISFSLLLRSLSSVLSRPLFFLLPPFFVPPPSFPTLDFNTFSLRAFRPLYRFCFFSGLPHCIQSGSTKLETAALSALLRLLLSAVPVSPCLLPFVAFFFLILRLHLCPFCSCSVGGPLLFASSREGSP